MFPQAGTGAGFKFVDPRGVGLTHSILPFTYAVPPVVPTEASRGLAAVDLAAGVSPGALMAPNWVFPCGPTNQQQCFTEGFVPSNTSMAVSCVFRSPHCLDSVTRGLLSGLQPIMPPDEPLFGPRF
jgi:hypothetical protein